jgi:hypothetical protein
MQSDLIMTARRALAYIQMMRPVNGLMQAFAVSIGFLVVEYSIIALSTLALGITTAILTTGAPSSNLHGNTRFDRITCCVRNKYCVLWDSHYLPCHSPRL